MPSITTPPPVVTCPSWCEEPHRDDWINDDNGLPARLHQHQDGQVALIAEEHLTDGRFSTDDPAILANVADQLTIEQAEQLAQDLLAAVSMARGRCSMTAVATSSTFCRTVAELVTADMNAAGLSVSDLADRAGISKVTLARALNGGTFKMGQLGKVADVSAVARRSGSQQPKPGAR